MTLPPNEIEKTGYIVNFQTQELKGKQNKVPQRS